MPRPTMHGEIWWAELDKRRPAIIVSRDDIQGVRQRTTVAPVTTTVRRIASEVQVDQSDGMNEPSAVNCDELVTIHKSLLVRRVGQLSSQRLQDLHRALAFAFAFAR